MPGYTLVCNWDPGQGNTRVVRDPSRGSTWDLGIVFGSLLKPRGVGDRRAAAAMAVAVAAGPAGAHRHDNSTSVTGRALVGSDP